ncbi:hypothetical protein HDU81_008614 [Chytriomyces hyalinus]|nr:hypothetical protein HDU81_008614 [Chytriomyces hyalinus]
MASDPAKTICVARWKYFCKRIEYPAWQPIRVALLGPDEEEAARKLDVIAAFLKTSVKKSIELVAVTWPGSGKTADYTWLAFDQAWDPNGNFVVLDAQPPIAVYCRYKTAATYGEYTHPLSKRSCSLIRAIRDLSPHSKFVLWDWSHPALPKGSSYPENALRKLLGLAWHCIVLRLPGEPAVGDVTFNFLRKFPVTCMMGEGNLNLHDEQRAVAKAMGNSVAIQQMAYVKKTNSTRSNPFNPLPL